MIAHGVSRMHRLYVATLCECLPSGKLCQRSLHRMMVDPSCLNNYRSTSHSTFSTHLARRAHQSVLSTVQGYGAEFIQVLVSLCSLRGSSSKRRKNLRSMLGWDWTTHISNIPWYVSPLFLWFSSQLTYSRQLG